MSRILLLPLLTLAACQTSTTDTRADAAEVARLRAEVEDLRAHVASMTAPGPGFHGTAALLARVEELLVRQTAMGGPTSPEDQAATVTPAAARSLDAETPDTSAAVAALMASLRAVESASQVHAENIANAGVVGFKRRQPVLGQVGGTEGHLRTPAAPISRIIARQGVLEHTGNALDLAIEGEGYLQLQLPNGDLRYTRDGAFRQDSGGRLVSANGHLLTDQVAIPPQAGGVTIASDGQVFCVEPDNQYTSIGTIRLHTFPSPASLATMPDNSFAPTPESGAPSATQPSVQGAGSLRQGYLERSNVHVRDELLALQKLRREALAVRQALATYGYVAP